MRAAAPADCCSRSRARAASASTAGVRRASAARATTERGVLHRPRLRRRATCVEPVHASASRPPHVLDRQRVLQRAHVHRRPRARRRPMPPPAPMRAPRAPRTARAAPRLRHERNVHADRVSASRRARPARTTASAARSTCTGGTCASTACMQTGAARRRRLAVLLRIRGSWAGSPARSFRPSGTGYTCTTLGEACTGAVECCSRTARAAPACPRPPATPPGDICYAPGGLLLGPLHRRDRDVAGPLRRAGGGCTQDGVPCDERLELLHAQVRGPRQRHEGLPAGGRLPDDRRLLRRDRRVLRRHEPTTRSVANDVRRLLRRPGGQAPGPHRVRHLDEERPHLHRRPGCNPPGNICG